MRISTISILMLTFPVAALAIPPAFEQRDPNHFLARFGGRVAAVQPDRVVLGDLTLRFAGASADARLHGLGSASPSSYLRAGVARTFRQYPKLAIHNLYRGVDAVFYGDGDHLEYDLTINPGASPGRIRISIEGARAIRIDAAGKLLIDAGTDTLEQLPPRVFQGARRIPAHYVLLAQSLVGIRLGDYDHRRSLVIDPVLAYVRSYGENNSNLPRAIALDAQGNIYVAGQSNDTAFPTTSGALQPRSAPPLRVLSNAGQRINPLKVAASNSVGVVGGTSDGRILYASTADGIFLSGDAGATWRTTAPLPVPGALSGARSIPANAITVDSLDPATVLVATAAGLFGTTSGGQEWAPRNVGLPVSASGYVSVTSVLFDPGNPLIAYATTNNPSYLFKSTDAGGSWQPLNPTYPGEPAPSTLPVPPMAAALSPDGKALFVVNGNGTLLKSLDAGATWTKLAPNVFYGPVNIQFDPANPNTIYVLDLVNLRKSTDGGSTFSLVSTPVGPRQFALDSSGALYAADYQRIGVSTDGGATFAILPGLSFSINSLTSLAGNVYAGSIGPTVPFIMKLDPTGSNILYSTFLGGSSGDFATALAVDPQGVALLAGITVSPDFPLTLPAANLPGPGNAAGFVAKLSADGSHLIYSTLLGVSKGASVQAVALDSSGAAVLAGSTNSTSFPTTAGAFQPAIPAGDCPRSQSAFFINPNTGSYGLVAKLSADGGSLLYATYLTGTCGSVVQSLALDADGNAVVGGFTTSPDFPVLPGSYQPAFPGQAGQPSPPNTFSAGFVSKLSAAGDKLLAGTYLGGGYSTEANAITLDAAGNPYITGYTQGFATGATPGVFQGAFVDRCSRTFSIGPSVPYTGAGDAFVLKLDPGLSSARFLTYLGGACEDWGSAIALDAAGNIWVSGVTESADFPLRDPFEGGGFSTGFLTQLSPDASTLLFSSLSNASSLAVGPAGIYQAGSSGSSLEVARIDPLMSPAVHIDSITPMSGFTPDVATRFAPGVAPGQLIEIKGRSLGPPAKVNAELDAVGRLPFVLGSTFVSFGNIPAPLISVQSESIVCFAPFEVGATTQISVTSNGQKSNTVQVGVPASSPQVLNIVNADGTLNSADHPAKPGSTIAIYVSGLGQTNPLSVDGLVSTAPLAVPLATVRVFLQGTQLLPANVSAAAGLVAGISQVNVPLPASIPDAANKVAISVNAAAATLFLAQ